MRIGVSNNLPLRYFPYLEESVKPLKSVNRKFLLKCKTLQRKNPDIVLSGGFDRADISFRFDKKLKNRPKVIFSANREDLIRYISMYDMELDIYPVDSLDFRSIDFVVDDNCCWVVFVSKRAVDFFFSKVNARFFCSKRIAAVGNKTAKRVSEYGFKMDYVPEDFYADSLIEFLKDKEKVLVVAPVKYNKAFDELKNIKVLPVYENIIPATISYYKYENTEFDFGLFTSPSAFWHIKEAFGSFDFAKRIKRIVAIGKTTKNYIESCGFEAHIPQKATISDMFEYISKG